MKTDSHYLIATDLDGTLLNHDNYSYRAAQDAVQHCRKKLIPIIFNTSKTQIESLRLRAELDNEHPFIVENGSAVIIPKGYFPDKPPNCYELDGFWVRRFGQSRADILVKLEQIQQIDAFQYVGFSNWSPAQIAEATNLSTEMAKQANQREFSEPFIWQEGESRLELFRQRLIEQGLMLLKGGRFYHVLGETNKGLSLAWLKSLYELYAEQSLTLIALGDSANDIDMLESADIAVVIKSPAHLAPQLTQHNRVMYTQSYGPAGWNEAILSLLAKR